MLATNLPTCPEAYLVEPKDPNDDSSTTILPTCCRHGLSPPPHLASVPTNPQFPVESIPVTEIYSICVKSSAAESQVPAVMLQGSLHPYRHTHIYHRIRSICVQGPLRTVAGQSLLENFRPYMWFRPVPLGGFQYTARAGRRCFQETRP